MPTVCICIYFFSDLTQFVGLLWAWGFYVPDSFVVSDTIHIVYLFTYLFTFLRIVLFNFSCRRS